MTSTTVVLVGPTGVGKTAVSIPLALHLNAEIISADSRQLYRHMDIVTAKPSTTDRREVPHHFIDHLDPDASYSAGQFGRESRACAFEISDRGRRVLVVGGSGLYVRAFVDGMFEGVTRDESTRQRIRQVAREHGTQYLHDELRQVDPVSAARIAPKDLKRIERALEVYRVTGKPMSEWHQDTPPPMNCVMIGLSCERMELYRRIEARVDMMFADDQAIDETRRLLEMGYAPTLTSMEGIGYRDIVRFLQGEISREQLLQRFKQDSRNYAKRQMTWFRRETSIRWVDVTGRPLISILDNIKKLVL